MAEDVNAGSAGGPGAHGAEGADGGGTGGTGGAGGAGGTGKTGKTGDKGDKGDTGQALPRSVKRAFLAVVLISSLALSVVGCVAKKNRELGRQGEQAHKSLCVIKANFQLRADRTETFLKENKGPKILGIDRADFERSLNDINDTLKALEDLECVPPPKPTESESADA